MVEITAVRQNIEKNNYKPYRWGGKCDLIRNQRLTRIFEKLLFKYSPLPKVCNYFFLYFHNEMNGLK